MLLYFGIVVTRLRRRLDSVFGLARPFFFILARCNQIFEREHPFEVVTHTYQRPFQPDLGSPPKHESPESHHFLDNPKDRLHRLLPQFVERLARLGFQAVRHDLLGRSLWTRRRWLGLRPRTATRLVL